MKKYLIHDFEDKSVFNEVYGREPVIALMPNGTLVCTMLTGGPTEPHNDNYVMLSKSYDGGVTWSKGEKLFSHSKRGVWSTEIFMGYEYPMMVLSTYNALCPYKELQTFVSYTYDCGETWSELKMIAPYANGLSLRKGIVMSNGEALFPVYHTQLDAGFGDFKSMENPDFCFGTKHRCGVAVSGDNGKSYTPYGDFCGESHLWEPNCVEVENGHIVMYMRDSCKPRINMAESFDYGRTWKHNGRINMYNSDAKLTLFKIRDKIFLISNVADSMEFAGRKSLQINRSNDGCKTWEFVDFVDDPEKPYFYPHVATDEINEILYVAYENGRQHYIRKFKFDEIL